MTETARLADYVLPAATQFEKWEATFFNFDFPRNVFHLRRPLLAPPDGPLPEPEIHARLVEALGRADRRRAGARCAAAAAARGRAAFAGAFFAATRRAPGARARWRRWCCTARSGRRCPTAPPRPPCCGPPPTAAPWPTPRACAGPASRRGARRRRGAVRRHPVEPVRRGVHRRRPTTSALAAGRHRRRAASTSRSPSCSTSWRAWPPRTRPAPTPTWPFVLSAGERRSFTRQHDHPRPGVAEAGRRRRAAHQPGRRRPPRRRRRRPGAAHDAGGPAPRSTVEVRRPMQPGHVSLPNGLGLDHPDADGATGRHRRRAERAHRRRRPRPVRRHAVAQARPARVEAA